MSVLVYTGKDGEGNEWPPDSTHEATAALDIIRRLWVANASLARTVAVVANVHFPSADLVIITELGIGVVELKHCFGRISVGNDGAWYAGVKLIRAGSERRGRVNPHDQVQEYAENIRAKLIQPPGSTRWLPGRPVDWPTFKFGTAICFAHPDASVEELRAQVRRTPPVAGKEWESFSVLKPEDVASWAATLRFEADRGYAASYEPYKLTLGMITQIAIGPLWATEWSEIKSLMPTGEAFAFLILIEGDRHTQIYPLDREELIVGRDPRRGCAFVIPGQFSLTSRRHCRFVRTVEGLYVEDLKSTNGTFVDGIRTTGPRQLVGGAHITLGGPKPDESVCLLELRFTEAFVSDVDQTGGGSPG